MIRIALDSNILVYLESAWKGDEDAPKTSRALEIVDRLEARHRIVAPVQALGELVVVMRRGGYADRVDESVRRWTAQTLVAPSTATVISTALDIAERHRLQFWDSMIMAASLEAGCSLLLSEDMQDGFAVRGLTVVNPLLDVPHRALRRVLDS